MQPQALFLGTYEDKQYVPMLKGMFNGLNTWVCCDPMNMLTHLEMYCAKRGVTRVVSTNTHILSKLLETQGNTTSSAKLSDYQGSLFQWKTLEIVFISPLKQLFTVPYGKFIATRFISKVAAPESWAESTKFQWELLNESTVSDAYRDLAGAFAIACDIETFQSPLSIRCIGYTGIFLDGAGNISTRSYVLPIDSQFNLTWMRKINDLPVQKIFQRGKYDNSYLLRYSAPIRDWRWDTANCFHAWYSELPKDLAFLNAFFLRKVVYWKDLSETTDLHEYYRYNAMDTWATANVWIQWILTTPEWAKHNYTLEFPLNFPCLLAELTGIKRDHDALIRARTQIDSDEGRAINSLRKILGYPTFNPGSPLQVKLLLKLLGCGDLPSTDEINLDKAKLRHPINGRILELVLHIRGLRKLKTQYLRLDSDGEINKRTGRLEGGGKEFHGRILYSLNPDGTDSGRLASREHHFWTGLQIQNIPVGEPGEPSHTKATLCADDGFFLGECDLEQAESRDTGYISGETRLIAAVTGERDFHSVNASAFFGRTYESIYDQSTRKTKDKPLRDLSKRTNHGATYNMGPTVIVDTMGLDKIWFAKAALGLPYVNPLAVGEHLLTVFHLTYPGLRGPIAIRFPEVQLRLKLPKCEYKLFSPGTFYAAIAHEVTISNRIVSRACHHSEFNARLGGTTLENFGSSAFCKQYIERGDWTRYCFGKPDSNKLDLNSYASHPAQSLNARTLNEAWMRVFYEVALHNPKSFRLHAQIHDSILFSYKFGWDSHADAVRKCMEIPVTVRDVHGTYRTFTVPAALKLGRRVNGEFVRAKYWSETE